MNDQELLNAIEQVCAAGGDVRVGAINPWRPEQGMEVQIRTIDGPRGEIHFHAGPFGTAREALIDAVRQMNEVFRNSPQGI